MIGVEEEKQDSFRNQSPSNFGLSGGGREIVEIVGEV